MTPLWIAAVLLGIGAAWLGWPAWTHYQAARRQATNTDRYLAWRGRADRSPSAPPSVPVRIWLTAGLAAAAVACGIIGLAGG